MSDMGIGGRRHSDAAGDAGAAGLAPKIARTSWGAVSPPASSPSRLCFSSLAHQGDPIMEGRLIRANRRPAENMTFSRTDPCYGDGLTPARRQARIAARIACLR